MTRQTKQGADNRANQLNSTHPAYHRSRGHSSKEAERAASEEALANNPAPKQESAPQPADKPSPK